MWHWNTTGFVLLRSPNGDILFVGTTPGRVIDAAANDDIMLGSSPQ
jgi:hypothetical protein